MTPAILYSFRRCPYAMRARLGILAANQQVELREIELKHKPPAMLAVSPKGTVPVLVLPNGKVIDESLDIMLWALALADPHNLLRPQQPQLKNAMLTLIHQHDNEFKPWLDKYKYADRHPEFSQQEYRQRAMLYIKTMEVHLNKQTFLLANQPCLADFALFPFIRQFAAVDKKWFAQAPFPKLQQWLNDFDNSALFKEAMTKFEPWLATNRHYDFGYSS